MKRIFILLGIALFLSIIPATSVAAASSPWISSVGCPSSADQWQSFNCNPSISGTVTSRSWSAPGGSPSSGSGSSFSTSFNSTGTKTITLRACNGSLCMSKALNVTIYSLNWSVSLSASKTNPQANESVTLTANVNYDVGPTAYGTQIYNASNGAVVVNCSSGRSCSAQVSASGVGYAYRARIGMFNGSATQTTSNTVTINWSAPPPTLNALGCPTSASQGQSFSCNPSTSGNITSRAWSASGGNPSSGSGSSFTTNFNSSGTKTISLTVCNGSVCINRSQSVTINYSSQTKTLTTVPYVNQITAQGKLVNGLWYLCGPSSTAMILGYYGKSSNPTYDAGNSLKSIYDTTNGTRWDLMSKALRDRGVQNSGALGTLTFDQIVAEIDANHPVIYGVWYSGGGHVSVIVGYDKTDKTIIVNDPFGAWGWWSNSSLINTLTVNKGKNQKYYYDRLLNGSAGARFGNMMKTWM